MKLNRLNSSSTVEEQLLAQVAEDQAIRRAEAITSNAISPKTRDGITRTQ